MSAIYRRYILIFLNRTLVIFLTLTTLALAVNVDAKDLNVEEKNVEVDARNISEEAKKPGEETKSLAPPQFKNVFLNIPSDLSIWGKEVIAPDNRGTVAALFAMTGLLVTTDYETWQMVKRPADRDQKLKDFMRYTEKANSMYFQVGSFLSFYGAGLVTNSSRATQTAYDIGEAILSSGVVIQVTKRLTGRESPKTSFSRTGEWQGYPGEARYRSHVRDYDAMPSGHLSSSFAAFTVIKESYPEVKWIPYVGYPVMGLFALSLVGTNIHWWSDFPFAIALGHHFGKIVTHRHMSVAQVAAKSREAAEDRGALRDMEVVPAVNGFGEQLLALHWQW